MVHVWEGAFFRIEGYLARFEVSMKKMSLDVGMDRSAIRNALIELVATSGLQSAYVSMGASRGTPLIPGTRDTRGCRNHFYAWAVTFIWVIPEAVAKRGAHIAVARDSRRIPSNSVDPPVKNYHWGDMTAALFQALGAGYDTPVLPDHNNLVTEGPGFNILAVINGKAVTSKSGMLEGISRKTVLEICAALAIPCAATAISEEESMNAEEVLTATIAGGPVTVTRVNGRIFGNDAIGPLTAKI